MVLLMAAGTHCTHPPQVPPLSSLWRHLRQAATEMHAITTEKSEYQIIVYVKDDKLKMKSAWGGGYLHISSP